MYITMKVNEGRCTWLTVCQCLYMFVVLDENTVVFRPVGHKLKMQT